MFSENRCRHLIVLLACIMTTCAVSKSAHSQGASEQAPAGFPEAHYRQAQDSGKVVLRVDSTRSYAVIEVHRAGPAAWLGHDHVVASHHLSGFISMTERKADLYVPLEQLVVDEPGLRTEAGFDTQPSQDDIEATRRNMLNKSLNSDQFPYAYIHVDQLDAIRPVLNVSITLHGNTRTYEVKTTIEPIANGIMVDGKLSFNQSDFGITPLSVFGGAIQVRDKLDLRFHIRAHRD